MFLFSGFAEARAFALQRKAALTRQRIIRTMATVFTDLFYDTIKGGDFRAREANVYRLAQIS